MIIQKIRIHIFYYEKDFCQIEHCWTNSDDDDDNIVPLANSTSCLPLQNWVKSIFK